MGGFPQTTRTLRIFLSHTVSSQLWQTGDIPPVANFETGEGIPAWAFKIEGRLLEVSKPAVYISFSLTKSCFSRLPTLDIGTKHHSASFLRLSNEWLSSWIEILRCMLTEILLR